MTLGKKYLHASIIEPHTNSKSENRCYDTDNVKNFVYLRPIVIELEREGTS